MLLAGVLVAVLVSRGDAPPTRAERVAGARTTAATALDGLELLQIEYGQAVRGGRVIAPTEYEAAKAGLQRIKDALRTHADDLRAVDSEAPATIQAALGRLRTAVAARRDRSEIRSLIDAARARLMRLSAR